MEKVSTPITHRCTQCPKTYSRRENLVRHQRSAHGRNGKPYACSQCPSRFTRSDLLSRHRRVHQNGAIPLSHTTSILFESNQSDDASGTYSLRQTSHDEIMQHRDQGMETLSILNPPSSLQRNTHYPVLSPIDMSRSESGHLLESSNQKQSLDWDLQWPFYGEGLPDVNLGWTLDFLSNDGSTHTPLDFMHNPEEINASIQLDGVTLSYGEKGDPRGIGPGGTQDDAPLGQQPRIQSQQAPGSAAYVDPDERNNVFITNQALLNPIVSLSCETHISMMETVTAPLLEGFCSEKGKLPQSFPPLPVISYFLQLFFVHVQPRFPVLHIPTFDPNTSSSNLLLAMAIMGSKYSESNQGRFALAYLARTRKSIKLMQESDQSYLCSPENLLAFLLVSFSAMWVGQKAAFERAECDRGELAVYCRRGQLLDCRMKPNTSPQLQSRSNRNRCEEVWTNWIAGEQKKRLGLCIYLLDCQMAAVFQRPPYISKAETINSSLPCSKVFWSAESAWSWKALLGPAEIPPSTYFLTTLTTILLHHEIPGVLPFPALDEFCKTLFAYVLHTHIFEWRQTICMLNPTGLITSPLSLGPENIGNSLQERQNWLECCLSNWALSYGDANSTDSTDRRSKSSSGILLYHLARLALHLNFSDLHTVASRSSSHADIGLAVQSLRNWLQGERVRNIFGCNSQMLDAAHEAIAAGDAQKSGFELVISLFMGGLISWAISRFGCQGLTNSHMNASGDPEASQTAPGSDGSDGSDGNGDQFNAEESPEAGKLLFDQVAGARDGLHAVRCVRLAVSFREILSRLLSEPMEH